MTAADIVLSAENYWSVYQLAYSMYFALFFARSMIPFPLLTDLHLVAPPSWVFKYPPTRFWHVIHTAPSSACVSAFKIAASRNAGYVFVTDAST